MGGETSRPQHLPADIADEPPIGYAPEASEEAATPEGLADGAPQDLAPERPDLEELYRRHCHELGRLAFLLTANRADAEDVVVDVFVTLAERYDVRNLEEPLSFIRAAVVNKSRSLLRHRVVIDKHAPKPPPDAPSAEHGAMERIEHQEVVAALRQLPPRQREAIVLRYYLDLSEVEIAKAMGVRPGSVKGHTSRAMAKLRTIMMSGSVDGTR